MAYKFQTAVLGGTFDHLHKGHRKLLEQGLLISENLIIGITSDSYISTLKLTRSLRNIEDFKTRSQTLDNFLNQIAPGRYKIVEIDDIFGPTLDKDFNAQTVIVSPDTKKNAQLINSERREKGLAALEIVEIGHVFSEDEVPISSERIRAGRIDRDGNLYARKEWIKNDSVITEELRGLLKKPWGELLSSPNLNSDEGEFIITVGDETTKTFNNTVSKPVISVVDFKVAREKKFSDISELGFSGNEKVYKVKNPSGGISSELFKIVESALSVEDKAQQIILIDGEDDLAVLPIVLLAPLGMVIYYGQPGEGIVRVVVNEDTKSKIREIVAKFNTRGY